MANRDNFKPVLNPPKDHAMIAAAQSNRAVNCASIVKEKRNAWD